jgi:hypothetical protein
VRHVQGKEGDPWSAPKRSCKCFRWARHSQRPLRSDHWGEAFCAVATPSGNKKNLDWASSLGSIQTSKTWHGMRGRYKDMAWYGMI